jgi:uncharacterized protein YdbL (DUF1318 family)
MQRLQQLFILLVICAITITCARITVNVYFPAAEIRDAASRIEREVRQGDETPTTPPSSGPSEAPKQQSIRWWPRRGPLRLALGVSTAAAQQQLDITISTPAIRRLIASRKARYPRLVPFFDQGALGENNRGLVEIRTLDALALRDRARVKALVEQENADRRQLYRALAEANNISSDRVDEIAAIFAEVNRKEAKKDWKIQEPNGQWRTK